MPRSRARKSRRDCRHRDLVAQPHRLAPAAESCSRCKHYWPCPSAIEGRDLTNATCADVGGQLAEHEQDRVALVAHGLVVDTGKRRRVDGEWHIVWSLSRKGRRMAPQFRADLLKHDEPPDDQDVLQVVRWLDQNQWIFGTRRGVAEWCGRVLNWPTSRVERSLLWAEANGFITGPDSA